MRAVIGASLLAGLVLFTSAVGAAAPTGPASTRSYAITHVTIMDVERGVSIPGQTVLIQGDRIQRIGPAAAVRVPASAQIVDGRGLFLMPGLVDAHVHLLDPTVFGRVMLANGVLLVRDMGMPNEFILKLRDQFNRGEILGPEMVATGTVLDGYPPIIPANSIGLRTPAEGRAAVRAQAKAGADEIKVYSRLDKQVFLAILDEAGKLGLKVVGHVPDSIYIEDAAAAGLSSAEHFFGFEKAIAKLLGDPVKLTFSGMGSDARYLQRLDEVDPAQLRSLYQRIRASGMAVCPTVITFKTGTDIQTFKQGDFRGSEYISSQVQDMWRSQWSQQSNLPSYMWRNWARMVRGLNEAGVPLMTGTDLLVPGILPGVAVHEEMAIWQDAGIPPADVLRGATIVPAQFMGLGNRLGSIREGKTASMVLTQADPLEDVRNAQQIEGVFLRGQYFNHAALDRLLDEAKDLTQSSKPGSK
jgi:imidazolonepropionase-like amidohydrolase